MNRLDSDQDRNLLPDPERNREIIASRLAWPDGALAACRDLEHRHPDWHCWWTDRPWRHDGNVPDGPCFGAAPDRHRPADSLYAASPAALAEAIEAADDTRRRAYPWLYR